MPKITLGLKAASPGQTADVEPKPDADGRTKGKVTTVKQGESVLFTVAQGLEPVSIAFKGPSPFGDSAQIAYGVPLTVPASTSAWTVSLRLQGAGPCNQYHALDRRRRDGSRTR